MQTLLPASQTGSPRIAIQISVIQRKKNSTKEIITVFKSINAGSSGALVFILKTSPALENKHYFFGCLIFSPELSENPSEGEYGENT
jgi:hypothetical protein